MDSERRELVGGRREEDKWDIWDKRIRDIVLFTLGTSIIINQAFFSESRDLQLIIIALGLVGTPFALLADARRRHSSSEEDQRV